MRVVYAGKLRGQVTEVSEGRAFVKVQFDNGTLDWFRTDLTEPEDAVPGGGDAEETPGVFIDRAGFLWLEGTPGDDGKRRVFCYDSSVRLRMSDAWRVQPLEDADGEFGPLVPMVPEQRPETGALGGRIAVYARVRVVT